MRKVVLALIIVLPMIFVLVLFSSVNMVSISVKVPVSGIQILADGKRLPEGEAMPIDMADMMGHMITAEVTPANAFEKGYTLESDNEEILTVNSEGYITAREEGIANVKATSKDKGFTASVPVVVTSSKAYDMAFSLYDAEGNAVSLSYNERTYTYTGSEKLNAGTYTYKVDIAGGDSKVYAIEAEDEIKAVINEGQQSIMFPFSGEASFKLEVPDALKNGMLNQTLERTVNINVKKAQSASGMIVNGVADGNTMLLAKGADKATMYVECEGEPRLTGESIESVRCLVHDAARALNADGNTRAANDNCHKLEIIFKENILADGAEELQATLTTAAGKSLPFRFGFTDFDFDLRSSVMYGQAGEYNTIILKDTDTTMYAVPAVELQGVTYEWTSDDDALSIKYSKDNRSSCLFNATKDGEYTVTVQAKRNGENLGAAKTLNVTVTTKVNSVHINNAQDVDLAERYTVGGLRFGEGDNIVDNDGYAIRIMVSKKGSSPRPNDFDGIEVFSSNDEIAAIIMRDNMAYLDIRKDGAIEVTARWKYNEEFGGKAVNTINLNVVKEAVEVSNYHELRTATEAGRKVVLTSDIMLGSDNNGQALPLPERQAIANGHKFKSTYNTEFYKYDANHNPDDAYVKYAIEFTNDVYGNGKNINAEYISNSMDASGTPNIFTDPLVFVEYRAIAAVRGQDNCSFLIRTDGVKLYGVNLLGCSDDSLNDESGNYELNKLNKIGTTLEINADCEIINCRIRNGRNVVRVYGGNRDGESYFVNSLTGDALTSEEQIEVKIEGCIITQGREFLVKVGANKALRANTMNGQEPALIDETRKPYKETSKTNNYDVGNYEKGSFFYSRYVMTDLTLKDTALETSGLFCIGVESNFSGAMLFDGAESLMTGDSSNYAKLTPAWRHSGGTSFASILRLEGDVRTYDWKDVAQVDSSTLIEATGTTPLSELMKFDIASLLKEVDGRSEYANLIYKTNNQNFVHGGIAFYGGGRNYSQIVINMTGNLGELRHLSINVGQFGASDNAIVSQQAKLLPYAAGTHDFNFWLYTADGDNNYVKQESDIANGAKYTGVAKVPLFPD